MGLIVLWLVMGGVVAIIANSKGFDTFAWLVYGALIWPIALAHVIVKRPVAGTTTRGHDVQTLDSISEKKCPDCAEMIKVDAAVCRFCGNRAFLDTPSPEAPDDNDAWFATLDTSNIKPPKAALTTWQKLW